MSLCNFKRMNLQCCLIDPALFSRGLPISNIQIPKVVPIKDMCDIWALAIEKLSKSHTYLIRNYLKMSVLVM